MWFEPFHKMDAPRSLDPSNFVLKSKAETCKGCSLCSKRCPMEALKMIPYDNADRKINKKGVIPELNLSNCIGCGVCVIKCPSKSLILEEKEAENPIPKNSMEWTKDFRRVLKAQQN